MLGLQPALLSSLAHALLRYSGSRVGATALEKAQVLSEDDVHDRLDILLDLLLSNAHMSGSTWDELSYHLITHPSIFLPRGVWVAMTERLLSEVIIAEGIAWFQRFEALSRIMGHPRGQQAAIAACVALANDPTNQVFMEPLSVLDCTRHRDANGHIKSQLINPTNSQALRGALLATVRKVRDHHFDDSDLTYLFDILVQHVSDESSHLSARPLASEILRMMPAEVTSHRSRALERALRDDRVLSQVLRSGRIAQAHVTAATVNRVCAAAIGSMSGDLPTVKLESVLAALVDEMLHSPISDIRLMAAQTIAATPFRYPVADGLMLELSNRETVASPVLGTAILGALPFVGRAKHRLIVERLALHGRLPTDIANAAVWAYAHMEGRGRTTFWQQALTAHLAASRSTPSRLADQTLSGLIYGLGVENRRDILAPISNDPRYPVAARKAAVWWLGISQHRRASART
ncbi:hypothetical protein GCM10009745_76440 [Kribbella yunnanensis]|uniref:HEAT repeat domain-containing protein n=2 Tax=Kribbella yunnanensis TaxID=190194 RepID=A0ABN2J2E3_9ACTN